MGDYLLVVATCVHQRVAEHKDPIARSATVESLIWKYAGVRVATMLEWEGAGRTRSLSCVTPKEIGDF